MDAERLQRVSSALQSLCSKAGFDFRSINHFEKHCCGLTNYNLGDWQSATEKAESLKALILSRHLSGKNSYIVSDSEACWQHLNQVQGEPPFHHLADFCVLHLFKKLKITPLKGKLLVHTSCSARRNGQAESWLAAVRHCAEQIECLKDIECCGFAGSKGFTYPDLNRHVLGELHPKILEEAVCGVSDSISCSWGLSKHTSIRFIHPLELFAQLAE
jgi:D-lactate dehydrogenase